MPSASRHLSLVPSVDVRSEGNSSRGSAPESLAEVYARYAIEAAFSNAAARSGAEAIIAARYAASFVAAPNFLRRSLRPFHLSTRDLIDPRLLAMRTSIYIENCKLIYEAVR